ncbi:MAG: hydrogenase formation protein HypD [Acidobacteria bacterium]|nr:hydrogenase formation protein HypD [Acidobacteriota bacterium]
MKYLDEYRDGGVASSIAKTIAETVTRPWVLMEVCGGQTHSIVRYGIDRMIPPEVELVHGPGCPVCVTSLEMIDKAHAIASRPGVIFTSFGDMLRVPGSRGDLLTLKSRGADVRVVYSPLDAVRIASQNPAREVVFFGIGFETTAPANAMAVYRARKEGVGNFSMLLSHVLVPPAMAAILQAPGNRVQGFLGPGHVCAIMGYREYESLAERYRVPIVITGFEPIDLLEGVLEVFEVGDRTWRGVGSIPKSGYKIRYEYRMHDAEKRFHVEEIATEESSLCISGQILRGLKKPSDCSAFGTLCTPQKPLGATMVSAEGACAAYYQYGRFLDSASLPAVTAQAPTA